MEQNCKVSPILGALFRVKIVNLTRNWYGRQCDFIFSHLSCMDISMSRQRVRFYPCYNLVKWFT